MSELVFDDVHVHFGHGARSVHAVRGVSFAVQSGSIVGLVGESGSGKSTIARATVGLVEPSSGSITLDGTELVGARGDAARLRRRIQMIFQDPSACLDPRMTIGESLAEALRATQRRDRTRRLGRQAMTEEAGRLLDLVSIGAERVHAYPSSLSGGQRQRVAIARALAAAPRVLLADEITSALDVSVQGSVLNLLLKVRRELGLTVLFVSHNLAVVRYVSEYVAVMRAGELVEFGTALDVIDRPQHPYTRELMAAIPTLGGSSIR